MEAGHGGICPRPQLVGLLTWVRERVELQVPKVTVTADIYQVLCIFQALCQGLSVRKLAKFLQPSLSLVLGGWYSQDPYSQ